MTDKSEEWDQKEKSRDSSGFAKRDKEEHEHEFNNGKCIHCGITREQWRKKW